jgi:dipeptidyl aminopeptidase/acylaminoacyl peptidase
VFRTPIPSLQVLTALLFAALIAAPASAEDVKLDDLKKQMADLQKKIALLESGTPATPAGKKPLTIADADTWRMIRGAALSNDGKWFAHRVGPMEGSGEVILRSVADGKETKFPAGGSGQMQFSFDSKWFVFGVTPYTRPGAPTAPGASRTKPKLVLVNTASGEKTELEGVSAFEFSGQTASHLVYRKATEGVVSAPGGLPAGVQLPSGVTLPGGRSGGAAGGGESTGHTGTDLVLRELATGVELVIGNVAEYSFDKKGGWLVMVIDAAGQVGNGIQLRDMASWAVHPVEAAKASFRGLNWNEDTTAFTVTKAVDDPGYEGKWVSVIGFTGVGPKPTRTAYDPKDDKDFPKDMAISAGRSSWTDALDAFAFSITARKKKESPAGVGAPQTTTVAAKPGEKKDEPKKDGPTAPTTTTTTSGPTTRPTASTDPKPELVIWHWKDERLQPMQQVQAAADKSFTYAAMYKVKEKKFLRLSDDTVKNVFPAPKQKFAIGRDAKPYEYMGNLDGRRYADIYVTNIATGERKKALTKSRYMFGASPTGTHFLYYDDGHFFTYDMAAGKGTNITEKVAGTSFVDTEDDHNVVKPPRSPVGWSRDGATVLLSDGWDIWAVKADGLGGTNLTENGKTNGTRYQGIAQFETEAKPGVDLTKPLYVATFGEWTKRDGLVRIDPVKRESAVLLTGDCSFGQPMKARDADVFAYTRQTTIEAPDFHLTDATFKPETKVTDVNPQQKNYLWTAGAKLIDYTGTGGKKLQGVLHLPADYQPGKTYPTVVYIYEKLSQGMHRYSAPSFRSAFNPAIYTSNGYAVFNPDITYRVNDPGKSSMECILPALDAAIASGVVDAGRVALHGHSWGGYQTAFAVTQTTRFKCAIAGAPLTDLISMYSSVYWNSGSANQPIFESSQGRFTAGYWEEQDAYIRNSPVYFAKNVQTPLLLLHNDKDGAVDFTQGVEYYNTLRRLQKPVVMLQYKGENHGLAKPENQKDYAVRMREFFDHYLKGQAAPEWWKDGVPHLKMEDHLKTRK